MESPLKPRVVLMTGFVAMQVQNSTLLVIAGGFCEPAWTAPRLLT